jgi:two-component system sensor kinase FixL
VTLGILFSAVLYAQMVPAGGAGQKLAWIALPTRYTIAEAAGILVIMPAAWCLLASELRSSFTFRIVNWDILAYTGVILVVLGVALERVVPELVAYYLLILPLVWAATLQGTAGAVSAAIVLEVGVTLAALRPLVCAEQMPNVQMLVLTLTLSGFLIGIAVDMARRASDELQQSLRLAATGEMAALAHELNQPLTALSAYGSACQRLVQRDDCNPLLQKTIQRWRRSRNVYRTYSSDCANSFALAPPCWNRSCWQVLCGRGQFVRRADQDE